MPYPVISTITILLYLVIVVLQALQLCGRLTQPKPGTLTLSVITLFFHGFLSYKLMFTDHGIDLDFFTVSTVFFFTINLTLLLSTLKKPLDILFLPWFSLTAIGLTVGFLLDSPSSTPAIPTNIGIHIVFSILAYSLLTIASLQALTLALQNWLLRHKHLKGWIKTLPPLQIMETLLFKMIWAGFILLSASLLTGFLFFEDMFAQHLAHKTFFSCLGWFFYAVLLFGHHQLGWRGNTAVRWTLGGFVALIIAFWGTKLVLEFFLTQQ